MAALVQTEYLNIETPTSIDVVSSQHHSVNQSTYYFLPHLHQNVIDIKRYIIAIASARVCNQDLVYMNLQSDFKIGRLSLIFFYWWLYNWGFLRDFSQIKAQNRRKRCKMSDNSLLICNNYLRAVEVANIRPPINICSRAPFQKNYLHIKASRRWYKICRKSFLHSSLPCLDPMLINKIAC